MSTDPARLSRRSLLRGAASVSLLAAMAAVSSCADDSGRDAGAPDPGSPLLRLAHSIPAGAVLAPSATGTSGLGALASDAAVVEAIDGQSAQVDADFASGTTVVVAGWLLSTTEAEALSAYAGACPLPAC
jgi:hypothetical protein